MKTRANILLSLVFIFVGLGIIYMNMGENRINTINKARYLIQRLAYQGKRDKTALPTPMMILTYMRSGSTFLSDVIQASPDVLFFFEPFWIVKSKKFVTLTNETIEGTYHERRRHIIDAIFSCNFMQLPRLTFLYTYFNDVGHYTSNFTSCIKNETELQCVGYLRHQCLKSKFVLIKTIRMRMHELLEYKNAYPDLKIIYLLRDPRAVLQSQSHFKTFEYETSIRYSRDHCRNMSFDSAVAYEFQIIYPDDICTVFYEHFSTDPVVLSEKLYKKFNINFTKEAQNNIRELTIPKTNCSRDFAICTSKINTTANVYRWREFIDYNLLKNIDNECENVYKENGFIPIPNKDSLRNHSFSTFNISVTNLNHI